MQGFGNPQANLSCSTSTEGPNFKPPIIDRRLFDITHGSELPNGEAGLFERLAAEVERTDWTNQEIDLFNLALEDMVRIHDGDRRGNHRSYVHMLRGAIRLISEGDQYFGVRDRPDLVIAYLLHDSVEDFAERWLTSEQRATLDLTRYEDKLRAQQMAFRAIEQRYGKRLPDGYDSADNEAGYTSDPTFGTQVSRIVEWMTSKPYPENLSDGADAIEFQKRKWGQYETGVRQLYEEEDAYGAKLLKTIDIIENFVGGMRHHESVEKRAIHARKYIFLVETVTSYIASSHIIPEARKEFQTIRLSRAFQDARDVINSHVARCPDQAELFDISSQVETARVMGRTAIDQIAS